MVRNSGARGLRAIVEGLMLDVMYEIPSRGVNIKELKITPEMVRGEKKLSSILTKQLEIA